MSRRSVILQWPINTNDDEGNVQQDWQNVCSLFGVLIAQSDSIKNESTGFAETYEYMFYTMQWSEFLVVGNRILANGLPLYISKILNHGRKIVIGLDSYVKEAGNG